MPKHGLFFRNTPFNKYQCKWSNYSLVPRLSPRTTRTIVTVHHRCAGGEPGNEASPTISTNVIINELFIFKDACFIEPICP